MEHVSDTYDFELDNREEHVESSTTSDWSVDDGQDTSINEEVEQDVYLRTSNELGVSHIPEEQIPFETVPDSYELIEVGTYYSIIDDLYIAIQSNRDVLIDLDSLLCIENRVVLGRVFDTFGQVLSPFYTVLLNNRNKNIFNVFCEDNHVSMSDLKIYCVSGFYKVIDIECIKRPGSDASNMYDEEVREDEIEYSDDNEELASKIKKVKKPLENPDDSQEFMGYRPLKRPSVSKEKPDGLSPIGPNDTENANVDSIRVPQEYEGLIERLKRQAKSERIETVTEVFNDR